MKKLFLAFALVACFAVSALSQGAPPWTIQEVDGSPRVNSPTLIKVTNGTLSCTGKTCTITISGGGGGSPGGSSTQVQYNAVGSFGGISGFTSDGTNVTAGSGNLRATRPRFITSIDDTNGNEVFVITATGSAVNEVTIANAATGNNPTFTASGGDANVGINFVPKGSGTIQVSGAAIVTVSATQTLTNKTLTTPIIAQISNTGTLTLPTSTDTLVGRATTDTLTNKTLSTSNTVSAALTWTAGVKQTFAPDATTAGINVGSVAGNPSGPSNADLWYNTATNELYARINGTNVALGSGGGGGITIGTTTITSGTNTRVLYNNSGVVGEYTITGTGNVVMSTSPTITTPAITTSATITRDAIGTASSTGFELTNTTAAAAGAQQFSPCAILTSQGWKTAATAASQSTNWCIQNQSVQGAANPTSNLVFNSQINGGGYSGRLLISSSGQVLQNTASGSVANGLGLGGDTTTGFWATGGFLGVDVSGTQVAGWRGSYQWFTAGKFITFGGSSGDASIERSAANTIRIGQQNASSTAAGNLLVGTSGGAIGTSGAGVIAAALSTAPANATDTSQAYSTDFNAVAGDARWHFLSEIGNPIGLGNNSIGMQNPIAANGASQAGRAFTVFGSAATASLDTAGAAAGGNVNINTGAAARLTSGNANGGDFNVVLGAGIGTGTSGVATFSESGASRGTRFRGQGAYSGRVAVEWYESGGSIRNSIVGAMGSGNDLIFFGSSGSTEYGRYNSLGNWMVGTSSSPASLAKGLVIGNGTAATAGAADKIGLWSADATAGDANLYSINEAGQINRLTGLAARNSAQFDKTSDTTLANVTGLTENVEASRVYGFRAVIRTTAAATGGIKLSVSGTATMTNINYEGILFNGATVTAQTRATALDTAVCAVTNTTAGTCVIEGAFTVNAAGTLTIQFAQNASDGTASSVLVNSTLQLIPIS